MTAALKNEAITLKIASLILGGMNAMDALKEVCGADVVDQMVSDLYDELRAKA